MNIRTILLDDDANSRIAASTALAAYPEIEMIAEFEKGSDLFSFLEGNTAHLLFLDIELNQEMGFDIASRLREEYPELLIVFLTGHSSYAIDGYDFHPINFLTKPINQAKLRQTVEEVRRRLGERKQQSSAKLMFHLQQGYRILDVREICYLERANRKNYLHTTQETLRIMNYTMKELEEMLSKHGFFLCHQSFIVSLFQICAIRDVGRQLYEVSLYGSDKPIPVSRNRYDELLRKVKNIQPNIVTK